MFLAVHNRKAAMYYLRQKERNVGQKAASRRGFCGRNSVSVGEVY